ncbi:hypothetical protein AB1Y20_004268 [Prymnesium parvum]|uniref:fructokinase n=1 Tax=Prymnesium parvum TaxID=97485 RepID=A0AB34J9Z2_PRYPA
MASSQSPATKAGGPRLAAVEGGGTTWVVAIAVGQPDNIVERAEFPTTTPDETLGRCVDWLRQFEFDSIGVASFGPVDLRPTSPTYGYITTTPKPGWQYVDVLSRFRSLRQVPYAFDTDVNAPALAEFARMQALARGLGGGAPSSCCYITVGTGIGVGLVVNGAPVHGLMHPEGGHLAVPRRAVDLSFPGSNPKDCFGGSCAENMCCSLALAKRAGLPSPAALKELDDEHEVWHAAAHYIGAMCANIVLLASPEKIVLSGGVMQRKSLFPRIRLALQAQLNGYIQMEQITSPSGIEEFLTSSHWGNNAGLVGALTLAEQALLRSRSPPASPRVNVSTLVASVVVSFAVGVAMATLRR